LTRVQRLIATQLAENTSVFPLPGYPPEEFKTLVHSPWYLPGTEVEENPVVVVTVDHVAFVQGGERSLWSKGENYTMA
jgi:hypothetical protein